MLNHQKSFAMKMVIVLTVFTFFLAGCHLPKSVPVVKQQAKITEEIIESPYNPPSPEETAIPVPVEGQDIPTAEATSQVFLPQVEAQQSSSQMEAATELAYLHDGNLFLVEIPTGSPRQLTSENDLLTYAWSPDGNQIAVYNGNQLCFIQRDGSSAAECLDLALDEVQSKIRRQIVWSPDQKTIVLWNSVTPWDEGAIGWMIINLDQPSDPILISDPVDWGLEIISDNEPGGITGQPIFLQDGSLLGTITHRLMCGSGGCHYQLFEFDLVNKSFSAYPNKPEEGFSEGQHLVLSKNGNTLVNFGAFITGCEEYFSFVDLFHLDSQTREIFNLNQEALSGITLSPDLEYSVISRTSSCSDPNQTTWASTCGLASGLDIYPMQVWELSTNQRTDLLPGVDPTWSPNGYWLAFSSCLTQNENGVWTTNPQSGPEVFVRSFVDGSVIKIGPGSQPSWRP